MTRYQGEDIEFALILKQLTPNDMQAWNNASKVVAYLYTHSNHIAKFAYPAQPGYNTLTLNTPTQLTGCIPTEDTKVMLGALLCDIYLHPQHGEIEQIRCIHTGINIQPTPIKAETH